MLPQVSSSIGFDAALTLEGIPLIKTPVSLILFSGLNKTSLLSAQKSIKLAGVALLCQILKDALGFSAWLWAILTRESNHSNQVNLPWEIANPEWVRDEFDC